VRALSGLPLFTNAEAPIPGLEDDAGHDEWN
jgi:hypothetical protein